MLAAVKLYEMGRLSTGAAAEFAGIPKPVFLQRMGDYGVAMFDMTEHETGLMGRSVPYDGAARNTYPFVTAKDPLFSRRGDSLGFAAPRARVRDRFGGEDEPPPDGGRISPECVERRVLVVAVFQA